MNANAIQNRFTEILAENATRRSRYRDAEERYLRARDQNRPGRTRTLYQRQGRATVMDKQRYDIPLPFDHAITQKHAYRIAGRLPDVVRPRQNSDQGERERADTVEKIIYASWRSSHAARQFASGAHHASHLGAACFDIYFDLAQQMPRFREIHPGNVIVIPGVDEQHDFSEVFRFQTVSRQTFIAQWGSRELPEGSSIADVRSDTEAGPDEVTVVTRYTPQVFERFAGGVMLEQRTHGYGFCPYVVIPNLGPIEMIWGLSDHEFYRHIAEYYETAISRQADVMDGTAGGAIQDFGTGQDANKTLDALRTGGVIPVKKDSQGLKPVETPQFGPWIDQHLMLVREAIDDLGFTPPAAWGKIGSTSGTDRLLQIAPQAELTKLKRINWSDGLARLNTMILKLVEQQTGQSAPATFRGTHSRKMRNTPFTIILDAAVKSAVAPQDPSLAMPIPGQPTVNVPLSPKELIQGDYETQVEWPENFDRDDPQFVLGEINKFTAGIQSAYTTLERLGITDPADELDLIQREAEEMPWLRSGMIALIQQQLDAANQGGGGGGGASGMPDPLADPLGAAASLASGAGGGSAALGIDALTRSMNGSSNAGTKRGGSPGGALYGGA